MANTFHGVPDKTGLARAVHTALKPLGRFAIVNWYRRPRENTTTPQYSRRHEHHSIANEHHEPR
ncbi:MAG TPA: hypothetical protein ENK62_04715 [Chromatiales bacterium]|nr:hypothetical protein [Chromatiales bacterium]